MRVVIVLAWLLAAGCGRLSFDAVDPLTDPNADAAPGDGATPGSNYAVEDVTSFTGGPLTPNAIIETNDGGYVLAVRFEASISVNAEAPVLAVGNVSTLLVRYDNSWTITTTRALFAQNETIGVGFCDVRDLVLAPNGDLLAGLVALGEGGDDGPCDFNTGAQQDPAVMRFTGARPDEAPTARVFNGQGANAQIDVIDIYGGGDVAVSGVYGAELSIGTEVLPPTANEAVFVGRINAAMVNWASGFVTTPNTGRILPGDIDINDNGELCLVAFHQTAITIEGRTFDPRGGDDVLVVGFDEDGGIRFATGIGSTAGDRAATVVALDDGSCVVGGRVGADADFGDAGIKTTNGGSDAFVAKIGPTGIVVAADVIGGPGFDETTVIRETANGELVAAIVFQDSLRVAGEQVTSAGGLDVLIVKAGEGTFGQVLERLGSTGDEEPMDLIAHSLDNLVIAVRYSGPTIIGDYMATGVENEGYVAWLGR